MSYTISTTFAHDLDLRRELEAERLEELEAERLEELEVERRAFFGEQP